jgi:hypothetical protein
MLLEVEADSMGVAAVLLVVMSVTSPGPKCKIWNGDSPESMQIRTRSR